MDKRIHIAKELNNNSTLNFIRKGDYKMAEHYKGMSIAFYEVQGKKEDPSFIDMLEDMLKTFKKNK